MLTDDDKVELLRAFGIIKVAPDDVLVLVVKPGVGLTGADFEEVVKRIPDAVRKRCLIVSGDAFDTHIVAAAAAGTTSVTMQEATPKDLAAAFGVSPEYVSGGSGHTEACSPWCNGDHPPTVDTSLPQSHISAPIDPTLSSAIEVAAGPPGGSLAAYITEKMKAELATELDHKMLYGEPGDTVKIALHTTGSPFTDGEKVVNVLHGKVLSNGDTFTVNVDGVTLSAQ